MLYPQNITLGLQNTTLMTSSGYIELMDSNGFITPKIPNKGLNLTCMQIDSSPMCQIEYMMNQQE